MRSFVTLEKVKRHRIQGTDNKLWNPSSSIESGIISGYLRYEIGLMF